MEEYSSHNLHRLLIHSLWNTKIVKLKELNIFTHVIIDYFNNCKEVYSNPTNPYQKLP